MNSIKSLSDHEDPTEAASEWCIRLSEGDMTDAEWAAFEDWHAGTGNSERLKRATAVWHMCGDIADAPEIITMRTEALTRYNDANRARWTWSAGTRWTSMVGVAAAVALVFGSVVFLRGGTDTVYETSIGERRIASLSDGSRLSLDAATNVGVTIEDGVRAVELRQGRALFDVAKDPLRPFTVAAGDKLIVAIGTSFSVELVGGEVRVNLYEGQVEIRDRTDIAAAAKPSAIRQMLAPGQGLVDKLGDAAPGRIASIAADQSLAWEQGTLSFENEFLASAVERMNRHSDVTIRLGSSSIATLRVDGEFQAGETDAFVEGIAAVHGLKARRSAGEVILTRD